MTSFSEPASACDASRMPPAFVTWATVSLTPSVRSTAITLAPSFVHSTEAARPMPEPAPVMMTDLPSRRPMDFSLQRNFKQSFKHSKCQQESLETLRALTYDGGED